MSSTESDNTNQPETVSPDAPDDRAPTDPPSDDHPGGATEAPSKEDAAPRKRRRPTLVVRYGRMGMLARFVYSLDRWRRGQRVVIKSDRGIEIGTIVCRWVDDHPPPDDDLKVKGEVLRVVTHTDEVEERHLEHDAQREFDFCKQRIHDRSLPMKLVAVEHLFGGDRIVFFFVAEKRIDFRALVRDLAREFQTRIEMRQIGVRDEARLLGDYERCGRPLCCRAFIKDLEPVSMKMAKVQKATLDPSKISGRCGRLMCCLRFEHATYSELARRLPRKNREVGTVQGRGKVVGTDIVTQMVTVQLEAGTRIVVPVESLIDPADAPEVPSVRPSHSGRKGRSSGDRKGVDKGRSDEGKGGKNADTTDAQRKDDEAAKGAGRKNRGRRSRRRSKGRNKGGSGKEPKKGGKDGTAKGGT